MSPMTRRRAAAIATVVLVLALVAVLVDRGVVWPNRLFARDYAVRGIDVSHHNGRIDWAVVARADVDVVWVKATEGSTSVDPRFHANWEAARRAGLRVGAYHFMSFESSGADQARHLIATVPESTGTLRPAVDLEPYGGYKQHMAPAARVRAILDPLLAALEAHYGVAPIIYTTARAYRAYLRGRYRSNPIWFRSVLWPPRLPDGRSWIVWQYSSRDHVSGIRGYVDHDVVRGSDDDLGRLVMR